MPGDSVVFDKTYSARAEQLRIIRKDLAPVLSHEVKDSAWVDAYIIAVNEACMNIIEHAYEGGEGSIHIVLEKYETGIATVLADTAEHMDLSEIKSRDLEDIRPGGLGVHFINEIMDEVKYELLPEEKGNKVTMMKYFEAEQG